MQFLYVLLNNYCLHDLSIDIVVPNRTILRTPHIKLSQRLHLVVIPTTPTSRVTLFSVPVTSAEYPLPAVGTNLGLLVRPCLHILTI